MIKESILFERLGVYSIKQEITEEEYEFILKEIEK